MPYKLLVLDLDGTLTNSRKEITPHTLETPVSYTHLTLPTTPYV